MKSKVAFILTFHQGPNFHEQAPTIEKRSRVTGHTLGEKETCRAQIRKKGGGALSNSYSTAEWLTGHAISTKAWKQEVGGGTCGFKVFQLVIFICLPDYRGSTGSHQKFKTHRKTELSDESNLQHGSLFSVIGVSPGGVAHIYLSFLQHLGLFYKHSMPTISCSITPPLTLQVFPLLQG